MKINREDRLAFLEEKLQGGYLSLPSSLCFLDTEFQALVRKGKEKTLLALQKNLIRALDPFSVHFLQTSAGIRYLMLESLHDYTIEGCSQNEQSLTLFLNRRNCSNLSKWKTDSLVCRLELQSACDFFQRSRFPLPILSHRLTFEKEYFLLRVELVTDLSTDRKETLTICCKAISFDIK